MVLEDAALEFPLELSPFQGPHVRKVTSIPDKVCRIRSDSFAYRDNSMSAQPNIQDLPFFFVRNPVEAVNLFCLFFDMLTQSTSPPVSSQPLHTDIVLRLTKLMQSVFDSCLSGSLHIPSESLAAYLIRICSAEKRFLGLQNAHVQKIIFTDMVSRLLLHRLSNRCTLAEDAKLRDLLGECPDPREHCESGSSLAILSSIAQLRSDDETGFVSAGTAFSEYSLSSHSRTKELGDGIYLSEGYLFQYGYPERYQIGFDFELLWRYCTQ